MTFMSVRNENERGSKWMTYRKRVNDRKRERERVRGRERE